VGEVFHTGQAVLRKPSLEAGPVKVQTGFLVRSVAMVPIRQRNEIRGVLGVYNRLATRSFNEHHLTLLMALADWAGVALDHAQLLSEAAQWGTAAEAESPEASANGFLDTVDLTLETLDRLLQRELGPLEEDQEIALAELKHELLQRSAMLVPEHDPSANQVQADLDRIVDSILEALGPEAQRQGLELEKAPSLQIEPFPGDPKRIEQVVEALVESALQRASQGQIVLNTHRFEVEAGKADGLSPPERLSLEEGPWVAVTVSDSSAGLGEDLRSALTDATIDPEAGRRGRGLSMGEIRLIANSIGGVLWHDESPAGTTLTFAIPT
jgi:signal transduction histidine kinase